MITPKAVLVQQWEVTMKKLPLGPIGALAISFLGLIAFFGAFLYEMQREYIEYGYPETSDEWAGYVGICLFLLGVLVFVMVAPLRAETRQLVMGPAVSFLGLIAFFGAVLYALQMDFNDPSYQETGEDWAGYVGICLFLLGALVFVMVAPLTEGTGGLIIGPAISFLGLLTYFGALLYALQLVINEYGYPDTAQAWALYIGACVFLLGGLILMVNLLLQLGKQIRKGNQG